MKKRTRQWVQVTKNLLICIDYQMEGVVATIETMVKTGEPSSIWSPNQDADMYIIRACVGHDTKDFRFNPHSLKDAQLVLYSALQWCLDMLGPPITFVSPLMFVLRCFMFWKYKILWDGFKIIGIAPRKAYNEEQKRLADDEWESIKRGFEKS